MNTQDLFKINRSSRRLNESLHRAFGKKLNLETFTLENLEDARNKLRTQLSQAKGKAEFNENLENDAYHQAQWMLDAINSEIAERAEYIASAGLNEAQDASEEIQDLIDQYLTGEIDEDEFLEQIAEIREGTNYYDDEDDDEYSSQFNNMFAADKDNPESTSLQKQLDKLSIRKNESLQGKNMKRKLRESEIQQASTIVTAKTMVDRVGRWIEELSGMENDTLLELGDSIRDEIGQAESKQFISAVAPAIQQALEHLKTTRETLANSVHALAGGEQDEMLGAEPEDDLDSDLDSDLPDLSDAGDTDDAFSAADPAAGGAEAAGRAKRESIERENNLLKMLAG